MLKDPEAILPQLRDIRKELHAHPELSLQEKNTSKRIRSYLEEYTKANVQNVGGTGLLVHFKGNSPGSSVMLRGDMDALPIREINEFEYKSNTDGVSHKCGHDGHTTIMLGMVQLLSETEIRSGDVYILFQPGEEDGEGAKTVLKDPVFKDLHLDYVFALHNLPGYPLGQVLLREENFTANVQSLIVKLEGKTSHAGEPEKGINPASTIAAIIQHCEEITLNDVQSPEFFLITPIHINMGEVAYGISAGEGEVHLTIRSWSRELLEEKCAELEEFIKDKAKQNGLKSDTSWTQVFYANMNDHEAVDMIRIAAKKSNLPVREMENPFKWGEDFGLFTQKYHGAMFGIGAGEDTPALHNPDYDYPDDLTPLAIRQFSNILDQILEF